MEQRQFEQAVQHMIHNEGVDRLTPDRVAYKLGIDARNAERMLDRMVTEGSLELDSDDEGNLFYFMPGVSAGGVFTPGSEFGPSPKPLDDGNRSAPEAETHSGPPRGYGSGPYGGGAAPYGAPTYQAPGYGAQPPTYGNAPPPYSAPSPYSQQGPPGYRPAGSQPPSYSAPPAQGQGSYAAPYGTQAPPNYGQAPYPGGGSPYQRHPGTHGSHPSQPGYGGGSPYGPTPTPGYQYGPPGVGAAYAYGSQALVPAGYQGGAMEPKSPAIASVLSAIFPGAGQLYNGQIGKGLVFFFVTFTLVMFSLPFGALTYLWNILDAYGTSKRINAYGVLPP